MRKSSQPKARWATRFRSDMQKSQQKPKGPHTHLGPYPKVVEGDESENSDGGQVLGGVLESVPVVETDTVLEGDLVDDCGNVITGIRHKVESPMIDDGFG